MGVGAGVSVHMGVSLGVGEIEDGDDRGADDESGDNGGDGGDGGVEII